MPIALEDETEAFRKELEAKREAGSFRGLLVEQGSEIKSRSKREVERIGQQFADKYDPQTAVQKQWEDNMKTQKAIHGDAAIKFDQDKNRVELLPTRPIEDIASVLTLGAKKYADRNWEKGFDYSRTYGALQRHLMAWYRGEDKDPETGLSHLAHAGCCIMFLLEFEHSGAGTDDRVKYVDKKEEV